MHLFNKFWKALRLSSDLLGNIVAASCRSIVVFARIAFMPLSTSRGRPVKDNICAVGPVMCSLQTSKVDWCACLVA